jgi:hypothetical protein
MRLALRSLIRGQAVARAGGGVAAGRQAERRKAAQREMPEVKSLTNLIQRTVNIEGLKEEGAGAGVSKTVKGYIRHRAAAGNKIAVERHVRAVMVEEYPGYRGSRLHSWKSTRGDLTSYPQPFYGQPEMLDGWPTGQAVIDKVKKLKWQVDGPQGYNTVAESPGRIVITDEPGWSRAPAVDKAKIVAQFRYIATEVADQPGSALDQFVRERDKSVTLLLWAGTESRRDLLSARKKVDADIAEFSPPVTITYN